MNKLSPNILHRKHPVNSPQPNSTALRQSLDLQNPRITVWHHRLKGIITRGFQRIWTNKSGGLVIITLEVTVHIGVKLRLTQIRSQSHLEELVTYLLPIMNKRLVEPKGMKRNMVNRKLHIDMRTCICNQISQRIISRSQMIILQLLGEMITTISHSLTRSKS